MSTMLDAARRELCTAAADFGEAANSIGATDERAVADLENAALNFVLARLESLGSVSAASCARRLRVLL